MNTGLKIGVIIGLIVIGIALTSPLFYDVEVDEPLPLSLNDIEEDLPKINTKRLTVNYNRIINSNIDIL